MFSSGVVVTALSDHCGQEAKIDLSAVSCKSGPRYSERRQTNSQNLDTFSYYLRRVTWGEVYTLHNFDDKFNASIDQIKHLFKISFPMVKTLVKTEQGAKRLYKKAIRH